MTSPPSSRNAADQALLLNCLDKVLTSPIFEKSHRQQDLLRHLFKETLNGNAHRLKGYTLGVEVFGRGTNFDSAVDAIVRVEVGRLRAKLREYYEIHGQSDAAVIDLPKGSYAVNITLRDDKMPQALSPEPNVNPWPMVIGNRPSLAVLPFANLSSEVGQDYFVDGLADSLIFELSRLSGLFVISRQSSLYLSRFFKIHQRDRYRAGCLLSARRQRAAFRPAYPGDCEIARGRLRWSSVVGAP